MPYEILKVNDNQFNIAGKNISVSAERDPKNLKWSEKDIDIVLECTGLFASKD